jgi:hypothetical protein
MIFKETMMCMTTWMGAEDPTNARMHSETEETKRRHKRQRGLMYQQSPMTLNRTTEHELRMSERIQKGLALKGASWET